MQHASHPWLAERSAVGGVPASGSQPTQAYMSWELSQLHQRCSQGFSSARTPGRGFSFFTALLTHRSCFVWLMMDRTFSSPSIFGRPYSSSFTGCGKGDKG